MNRKAIAFVALLAAALVLPGFASAGDMKGDLSLGYYSNYVWRGQTLSNDWVIQPELNSSNRGLGIGLWSNYDYDTEEINQTNFNMNFGRSYDKMGYEVGYIYYLIDEAADTQEFYLAAAHDSILQPHAAFYWDGKKGDGGFLQVGAGYSLLLAEKVSVDLAADVSMVFDNGALGRNEKGEEFTGLYNCDLSIGTSIPLPNIPLASLWSIEAMAAYSFSLSDDAEWALEQVSVDGKSEVAWWGIALKMAY